MFEKVQAFLAEKTEKPIDEIQPETELTDLGVDSMKLMMIVLEFETAFDDNATPDVSIRIIAITTISSTRENPSLLSFLKFCPVCILNQSINTKWICVFVI